ncbi:acyltransferase family protein [Gayadomonas joobiniege]|uniref:acyltransferase family protein n=1 Tax=Gayadomonas joobiniege TaxID=1234606 RepID=UPI0003728D84|nr:acyltransferase [Gayadomonas joobiniege]
MDKRVYRLDLLRAFAIFSVFLAHTVLSYGAPAHLAPLQFGGTGVDLFFVLSGWLIGSQLFAEQQKYGDIQVVRFWIRRWMRTLPAYYAVLIFTLLQLSLTKDGFTIPLSYFVFLQNYQTDLPFFAVSWSLSVEEQFYLCIAPIVVFLVRLVKHVRTLILTILLLMPLVFRSLGWYETDIETHVRWDCCLMGILMAQVYFDFPGLWKKIARFACPLAILASIIYCSFYLARWGLGNYWLEADKLALAFLFASWLIWATDKANKRFWGYAFIAYISTRSYSIYLLHPEALALARRFFPDIPFVIYFFLAAIISCLAAEVLFRLIEQPVMQMRSRFNFSCSRSQLKKQSQKVEQRSIPHG